MTAPGPPRGVADRGRQKHLESRISQLFSRVTAISADEFVRTGADRGRNPFTPDWGASPPVLVGRDGVLDRAVSGMLAGPSDPWFTHAYFGERGVGKTVLLDELGAQMARHGWVVAHGAVRAGGFVAPLLEVELVEAAQGLSRRIRPLVVGYGRYMAGRR